MRHVAASKRFYESAGPHAGFELSDDIPERAQFKGSSGSFSVVAGPLPTENVHMAFPGTTPRRAPSAMRWSKPATARI